MKRFLKQIGLGVVKVVVAFVVLAAAARFIQPLNWFFFQPNEHNRVYYMALAVEQALARGETYDILVLGSSACEFSIDPRVLGDATGMRVIKFVTGGQSIDMSTQLGRYLVQRLKPRYVILDAYPHFGGLLTEEGVERVLLNAPDARSELMLRVLAVDPWSPNTDYVWAARAIGTAIAPYDSSDLQAHPDYEMVAPGFTHALPGTPGPLGIFYRWPLIAEAVDTINAFQRDLAPLGARFVAIIPPIQNARIYVEGHPQFTILRPSQQPDTCFWDGVHMRGACAPAYTAEVATLFNRWRTDVGGKGIWRPVQE
jgi:hypothetical protein